MNRHRSVASSGLGMLDQGLTSVSNLVLAVSVARVSSVREFGTFGIAYTMYLLAQTFGRAVAGDVATLRLSQLRGEAQHRQLRRALAAALLFGTVLGVPILGWGIGVGSSLLVTLGIALPILLAQDALRYLAFVAARPMVAVLNDSVWLIAQLGALGVAVVVHRNVGSALFLGWAGASALGALVAAYLLRVVPDFRGLGAWLSDHRSTIGALGADYAMLAGVQQGSPLLAGAVSSASQVGALRAVQVGFGPVNTASTGTAMATVPHAARRFADGDLQVHRGLLLVGLALAALAAAWTGVLYALPMRLGHELLGRSWASAHRLALITGIASVTNILTFPAVVSLRIVGLTWVSARIRMVLLPVTVAAVLVGALIDGAYGASVAIAVTSLGAAARYWWVLLAAIRRLDGRPANRTPSRWPLKWLTVGIGAAGCFLLVTAIALSSFAPLLGWELAIAGIVVWIAVAHIRLYVALLLVVGLFIRTVQHFISSGSLGIVYHAMAALLFVVSVGRFVYRQRATRLHGLAGYAVFVAAGVLSDVLHRVPAGVAFQGTYDVLEGILVAWSVAQIDWRLRDLRRFGRLVSQLGMVIAGTAFISLAIPGAWAGAFSVTGGEILRYGLPSALGPFIHPYDLAMVSSLIFLALLTRVRMGQGLRASRWLLPFVALAVLFSFRRKELVALLASAVVGLGRSGRASIIFTSSLVLLAVVIAGHTYVTQGVSELYQTYVVNGSSAARTVLTRDSFSLVRSNFPLGEGFGRFGSRIAAVHYSPVYLRLGFEHIWGLSPQNPQYLTDTQWPAVLGESGLIGTIGFGWGLTSVTLAARRLARTAQHVEWRWIGLFALSAMSFFGIESTGGGVFFSPPGAAPFFAIVGIVSAGLAAERVNREPAAEQPPHSRARPTPARPRGRHAAQQLSSAQAPRSASTDVGWPADR